MQVAKHLIFSKSREQSAMETLERQDPVFQVLLPLTADTPIKLNDSFFRVLFKSESPIHTMSKGFLYHQLQ